MKRRVRVPRRAVALIPNAIENVSLTIKVPHSTLFPSSSHAVPSTLPPFDRLSAPIYSHQKSEKKIPPPPLLLPISALYSFRNKNQKKVIREKAINRLLIDMAEADSNVQRPLLTESEEEQRLKYFEFVQVATFHALMCAAKLYTYAKENSGPLKPGVDTVEGTVKTVVGPVYDKFHDVPIELLKFVDRKVDESMNKVQSRVPPTLKQVSTQAYETAQKAPEAARSVMSEVKNTGVVGTASGLAKTVYAKYEPAAKDLYTKCEPVAEQYAASAWRSLNQLPLFPRVAQALGPTAGYCSEMYNQTVQQAADKGYKVASHLPLVPTERIAKVLST